MMILTISGVFHLRVMAVIFYCILGNKQLVAKITRTTGSESLLLLICQRIHGLLCPDEVMKATVLLVHHGYKDVCNRPPPVIPVYNDRLLICFERDYNLVCKPACIMFFYFLCCLNESYYKINKLQILNSFFLSNP